MQTTYFLISFIFSVEDLRKLIEKAGGSMGNIYSQSASVSSSLNRPSTTTTEVSVVQCVYYVRTDSVM